MSAPWSKEQAEQWAAKFLEDIFGAEYRYKTNLIREYEMVFLEGLAKAARAYEAVIEASPTVYTKQGDQMWYEWTNEKLDTHQAKLVGAKPTEVKSSDAAPHGRQREYAEVTKLTEKLEAKDAEIAKEKLRLRTTFLQLQESQQAFERLTANFHPADRQLYAEMQGRLVDFQDKNDELRETIAKQNAELTSARAEIADWRRIYNRCVDRSDKEITELKAELRMTRQASDKLEKQLKERTYFVSRLYSKAKARDINLMELKDLCEAEIQAIESKASDKGGGV